MTSWLERLHLLKQQSLNGDSEASHQLALFYATNRVTARDVPLAIKYFNEAAKLGHREAQCNLGFLYASGQVSGEANYQQAVHWYQEAAQAGCTTAMIEIGRLYGRGCYFKKDSLGALQWYRKAAEMGSAIGAYNVAQYYLQGAIVAKDNKQAFVWLKKSAERGFHLGQRLTAEAYHHAIGTPYNIELAICWYHKAIDAGDAQSMHNLGWLYQNGEGVQKDEAKAAELFYQAFTHNFQLSADALNILARHPTYKNKHAEKLNNKIRFMHHDNAKCV